MCDGDGAGRAGSHGADFAAHTCARLAGSGLCGVFDLSIALDLARQRCLARALIEWARCRAPGERIWATSHAEMGPSCSEAPRQTGMDGSALACTAWSTAELLTTQRPNQGRFWRRMAEHGQRTFPFPPCAGSGGVWPARVSLQRPLSVVRRQMCKRFVPGAPQKTSSTNGMRKLTTVPNISCFSGGGRV